MFLVSGVFVWHSLMRKGAPTFLRDRGGRLGLPFLLSVIFLAPAAYLPAYLLTTTSPSLADFASTWLQLGVLPAGPAWFLWLLLAFDAIAATLFTISPRIGERLGRFAATASQSPIRFLLVLIGVSAASYFPLVFAFGPAAWTSIGPFQVQTSRILHYLAYFIVGIGIGVAGIDRGLLEPSGRLAHRWWVWASVAPLVYMMAVVAFLVSLSPKAPSLPWTLINATSFVICCAVISMTVVAVFVRVARPSRVFDSLVENAYGIYLVHYVVVSWVQYALLPTAWPGLAKAAVAFGGSLAISWALVAAARRMRESAKRRVPQIDHLPFHSGFRF
jgi:surface polysaccharide O-acyltransferase-like enzyme